MRNDILNGRSNEPVFANARNQAHVDDLSPGLSNKPQEYTERDTFQEYISGLL